MNLAGEKEVTFKSSELIISKTDLQGKVTYANRTFMKVANYSERDLLGQNHNIIRHPTMPRGVFYGLWSTLKSGNEFFGFIKNYTFDKNYYWVFANVTPDLVNGKAVGYYSVRRTPPKQVIPDIEKVYRQMIELEQRTERSKASETSWQWLNDLIRKDYHQNYEEFALSLYKKHR